MCATHCGYSMVLLIAQSQDALLNVIVMADYALSSNPEAMVIGVDADGNSYVLEEGGSFSTSTDEFEVTKVGRIDGH